MVFSIQKFSSTLCLALGTNQSTHDLPLECFYLTDDYEEVLSVIWKLGKIFENKFQSVVDEISDIDTLESCDSFMIANLSRYVKLSEPPSYFSFLLLCSLVETIIFEMFTVYECFLFAEITSLSLISVYNRCYKGMFKENEMPDMLGSYCKRLNLSLCPEGGISQLPVDLQELSRSILESLKDVDYKNFSLTDFEKDMLEDLVDLVPAEGVPLQHQVTTSKLCENNSSSTEATSVEKAIDSSNFPKPEDDSSRENRICTTCDGKCFKLLSSYRKELLERSLY